MAKLTKRAVDALAVPATGQAFLWDSELRGFGVRVTPSGLKTFILQYRTNAERSRRIVLGRYGVLTVEQARNDAREKLVAISKGEDPAEASAASRRAKTVADICDWYLAAAEAGRILGRGAYALGDRATIVTKFPSIRSVSNEKPAFREVSVTQA